MPRRMAANISLPAFGSGKRRLADPDAGCQGNRDRGAIAGWRRLTSARRRGQSAAAFSQPGQKPMTDADLAATLDAAWEARESLSSATKGAYRDAVEAALEGMDTGKL